MPRTRILDVTDAAAFERLPPCADPAFDHRTCDYWEEADRGSKTHRAGWLQAAAPTAPASARARNSSGNPLAPASREAVNPFAPSRPPAANPFAPAPRRPAANPFAFGDDEPIDENPFAPPPPGGPAMVTDGPRKLGLLTRGRAVFGSYAKVLLVDASDGSGERAIAYSQFGPLSAYPRALRLRELYPKLPSSPLPAVITCIATTAEARSSGHALALVEAVCADLASRGFAAVEAYPEAKTRPDATSAATPAFWERAGFRIAVADDRFPVMRREL